MDPDRDPYGCRKCADRIAHTICYPEPHPVTACAVCNRNPNSHFYGDGCTCSPHGNELSDPEERSRGRLPE